MPWTGGAFSRTDGSHNGSSIWQQAKAALVGILATAHDAHDQDLAGGINATLCKDGSNAPTQDLPMAGHKHTGAAAATASGQYMRYDEVTAGYQPLNSTLTAMSAASSVGAGAVPTGAMLDHLDTSAPLGWVFASGNTIGNAASSGTERANADTSALFSLLWSAYSNTICPVSTGRGVSAAADYAANKTITLPDLRGRVGVGRDNMGGTAANRVTAAVTADGTVLGMSGGEQAHVLTVPESAPHAHGVTDPTHSHTFGFGGAGFTNGGNSGVNSTQANGLNTSSSATGITIQSTGGGGAHNNMQPSWIVNKIIKL